MLRHAIAARARQISGHTVHCPVIHQRRIVLPHPAQVVLVHGEPGGAAIGHALLAMQAAADERCQSLPACLNADLVALHDLDVVGRDEAGRAEPELVHAQARLVDLGGSALEQHRLIIDVGLVDADRLQAADVRHDVDQVREHVDQRRRGA